MPVITLLSDFGQCDYFVGAVKGVMLSLNPEATLVDISHEIPPQGIFTGAYWVTLARMKIRVRFAILGSRTKPTSKENGKARTSLRSRRPNSS
jgi:hypothetical protein